MAGKKGIGTLSNGRAEHGAGKNTDGVVFPATSGCHESKERARVMREPNENPEQDRHLDGERMLKAFGECFLPRMGTDGHG